MLSPEARRSCHTAAVGYVASGMSVIPIRPGSDKAPDLPAGHPVLTCKRPPVNKEIDGWFRDESHGIAALCGRISNNLECLDFDKPELAKEWFGLTSSHLIGLSELLCWVQTPSGGWHCWYRCDGLVGCNTKLAYDTGHKTLIETRGEGGYALLPGGDPAAHHLGKPYIWKEGRLLTNLAVIETAARDTLLSWARSFTQLAEQASQPRHLESEAPCPPDELRPGDDFNLRGPDWQDILTPHGWKEAGKGAGLIRYWLRPDKAQGKSATTGCKARDGTSLFFPFSSNASPFEPYKGYSKFRVYAMLNHDGSQAKAASALRAQGYGGKRIPKPAAPSVNGTATHLTASAAQAAARTTSGWEPALIRLSEVTRRPVHWLWENWIPMGKLTVLDGDPGLGKSTILCDIAARITRNWAMPDDSFPTTDGNVILLTAEDEPEDTLEPRCAVHGGDLQRITALEFLKRNGSQDELPITFPDNVDMLEAAIIKEKAVLVVIDPVTSFMSKGIDYAKDPDVRRALRPLKRLAAKHHCAILYLRHLNKGGGTRGLYRGGGSIAFAGQARSGMMVVRDPDDDKSSVLAWVKGNYAEKQPSLRYGFEKTDLPGVVKIVWRGQSTLNCDDLLAAQGASVEDRSSVEEAMDFLNDFLANEPRLKQEVLKAAREQGISRATVDRARARLGIVVRRASSQEGKFSGNEWSIKTEVTREDLRSR